MNYDLAIIGGGPAGYTAAELAASNGLKTLLFEKSNLGGVCLNEGCIPTKTLLYSAKVLNTVKESQKYGIICDNVNVDLSKIILRKNKIVRKLTAGIRIKMQHAGVDVINGQARIIASSGSGVEIECDNSVYKSAKLLLCTGSEVIIPDIPGINEVHYWTNKEALDNKDLPASLLIVGGGVIGIEFASFFNTLGTKVVVVEMMDEILNGVDRELSELLRNDLSKRGIEFHLSTKFIRVDDKKVQLEKDGNLTELETEKILLSIGRKPIMKGWGLENVQLETFGRGLKVNEYMQTSCKNIYACGDITGYSLLAHTAVREAEVAVEHILGSEVKMNYKAVPNVIYTNPEVACVGKTEEMLQKEGADYFVKRLPLSYSGRFVAENEATNGLCKLIFSEDETLIGAHILGNPASEIITIAGIAIEKEMKRKEVKNVIFPHPTVSEIIRETL